MKGKDKCKILKEIRAQIAAANDIAWVTENCTHKGDCRGTCPKCEAEVATLERALVRRRALGKTVAVVGLSAGMIATTTACDALNDFGNTQLAGDMTILKSTTLSSTGDHVYPESLPPVPGEVEVDGDYAILYYTTDFAECAPVTYRATELIYPDALSDVNYSDWTVWEIAAGEAFAVVGESEALQMVLIDYHGQLFALYTDYLIHTELVEPEVEL